jgi:ABC-type multidrug transport system fused ATPase/permease subunit
MEMEISTDLARSEVDSIKASTTMSQLDQLLNMYNHVKQYGIDRTFLSLYNSNNQLNNMLGVKFPSCESVGNEGYPSSNMSRAFIVAMEDEKEGIFSKIGKGIQWIWEKIKELCTKVWSKLMSWFNSTDTTKRLEKCEEELQELESREEKLKRYLNTTKSIAKTTAKILFFPQRMILKLSRMVFKAIMWTVKCTVLWVVLNAIFELADAVTLGLGTILAVIFSMFNKIITLKTEERVEQLKREKRAAMESLSDTLDSSDAEKKCTKLQDEIKKVESEIDKSFKTEYTEVTLTDASKLIKDTLVMENKLVHIRDKINTRLKDVNVTLNKLNEKNKSDVIKLNATISPYCSTTLKYQTMLRKLMEIVFKVESKVRTVCGSVEDVIKSKSIPV